MLEGELTQGEGHFVERVVGRYHPQRGKCLHPCLCCIFILDIALIDCALNRDKILPSLGERTTVNAISESPIWNWCAHRQFAHTCKYISVYSNICHVGII